MAESHLFSQLGAQVAGSGVQNLYDSGLILLAADAAYENLSVLEVGRGVHISDGHELGEPGVSQVVLDELANFPADKRINAFDTM
jgi:hypothetical protein